MTRIFDRVECDSLSVAGTPVSGGGGGSAIYDVFSGYGSGSTNVAGSAVTLPANSEHITSGSTFTSSSGEVTVNATAEYTVSFSASGYAGGSSRTQIEVWLEVAGSEVAGTRGELYCRTTNYGATAGKTVTLSVTSGQVVRVRAQRTAGSSTCPCRATLHIDRRT